MDVSGARSLTGHTLAIGHAPLPIYSLLGAGLRAVHNSCSPDTDEVEGGPRDSAWDVTRYHALAAAEGPPMDSPGHGFPRVSGQHRRHAPRAAKYRFRFIEADAGDSKAWAIGAQTGVPIRGSVNRAGAVLQKGRQIRVSLHLLHVDLVFGVVRVCWAESRVVVVVPRARPADLWV